MFKQKVEVWIAAVIFAVVSILFGYTVEQSAFSIPLFAVWFIIYAWIIFQQRSEQSILFFLLIAAIVRLALIPAFPLLSDDIYRFIWDGRLIANGINPFDHLPSYWMQEQPGAYGLSAELFSELNSPNYFTIYPPICQGIFTISQWIAGDSIFAASLVMKFFLIAFEIGSLFYIYKILQRINFPKQSALLYALNPLVIIEISGNLHFEGPMVFFLLVSIWYLIQKKWIVSAIAISFSIASKLLPLMFLPLILMYLGWKKGLKYCVLTGVICLLFFAPLLSTTFLNNFGNSLDLYFQKFEFNASIYYIGRWLGQIFIGYNIIKYLGPSLALLSLLSICWISFRKTVVDIPMLLTGMLLAFTCYLFLGTTIHPWYLTIPILLSCFTQFRFPILWSGLIMLTYMNYGEAIYNEKLWIVSLEYVVVYAFFIYELLSLNVLKEPVILDYSK